MEGVVTSYDPLPKQGVIRSENVEFSFTNADYVSKRKRLFKGTRVKFSADGTRALNVEFVSVSKLLPNRSRKWSIFMALILGGGFGTHKMYLGKNRAATLMFMVSFVGLFLKGIPTGIMAIVSVCEGLKYLSLSGNEFKDVYVAGTREWF